MMKRITPIFARLAAVAQVGIIAIIVLSVSMSAQRNGQDSRLLAIRHVTLIDTLAGTTAPDMTVVIRDDRIVAVENGGAAVPRGAEIIDGRNKFLIPGLWDMHVHLSYARSSALPALVANGVTAVRDMGSDLAEIDRWRSQIAAHTLVGPTIVRAGPMLNGMEFNRYQLAVAGDTEARTAVRTLRKVGVDFIKLHRRTSREAYFAIADETRMLGLPFSGHVPITVSPDEASDAGQASLEHTETLFEGTFAAARAGKDVTAEIARWRETEASALFARFTANGTLVDPTLIAQEDIVRLLETQTPDTRSRYIAASARKEADKTLADVRPNAEKVLLDLKPRLRELRAVTGLMNRAGVKLLAGTDLSFFAAPGFSLHDELALLVESGLTATDALRAATVNPAGMFPSEEGGSIAPGKRADLVLLDANPLEDIRNAERIAAVVLRGRFLNRRDLDLLLRESARLAEIN
jgi:imidazolonepropionase-like amidohydrolase